MLPVIEKIDSIVDEVVNLFLGKFFDVGHGYSLFGLLIDSCMRRSALEDASSK
jgi:hypothetical protein